MNNGPRNTLAIGILFLTLTVINALTAGPVTPSFQRAEILAAILSVLLMLIANIWRKIEPNKPNIKIINEKQGFFLEDTLDTYKKNELAWGSEMFLTATASITVLIYLKTKIILRRGLIINEEFVPGTICERAMSEAKLISLVNTKLFPGKSEFESIYPNLPSIIVQPIGKKGWLILGGASERCFTKSDEKWIGGWSKRLEDII